MCGIAGVVSRRGAGAPSRRDGDAANSRGEAETTVRAMIAALRHRGPDDTGAVVEGAASFGHTRLSIIDPAGGAQPMRLAEDQLTVVFNGEIYNYIELRDELIQHGRTFRTRSDTEVVLHAFAVWGERAFERFNGQWARDVRERGQGAVRR
jgi:asparagine synthase (glutamine-hydrolysing)